MRNIFRLQPATSRSAMPLSRLPQVYILVWIIATPYAAQTAVSAATILEQDLNAATWDISNLNGTVSLDSVHLPIMVLEALNNSGKLPTGDPIAGYNDRKYAWVAEDTWSFETDLNVTKQVLEQQNVDLLLHGVDTVAEVYLENRLIAELNNSHREYRLPIKTYLGEGSNILGIVFQPSMIYARKRAAEYPYVVPMQKYTRGYDHYNFIRKPASDFGWDWGPAFAPSGIYGGVKLQAYSEALLTGASIRQEHRANGTVEVRFDAVLQSPSDGEEGTLIVEAAAEDWLGSEDVTLRKGENVVTVKVVIEDGYTLWWPAGTGEPFLYNFTLTYEPANGTAPGGPGRELERRLGLRTIELVEEPLRDPSGFSFYFRVNGVPLFAKGANMIPMQIFHSQNSEAGFRRLVEDAAAANMNMLRIWGGGLYQPDEFYDVADELGMLVWQEAMFACAQYPRDPDFLASVAAEVSYQARRLGHHASLAIWGGNNEVETAFEWFPESRSNEKLFAVDYAALFVDTIHKAISAVDPGVAFVDSSPSKGIFSSDPYIKRWGNPSAVNAGDVHFYDYSSNCLDPAVYPRAKFVSEYGFMSFPSFSVYKRYTEAKDWSIQSNMSDYRQRHPNGNAELQAQMQFHFLPIAANATNESLQSRLFRQWIYLTQVQQSLCYETAIANWRRSKSAPDARTTGVLYWQLNDIWAGPSWSGIDHGGHWKLLMYNVRKLFSPVAVSGTYNASQADALSVYVTNDQPWSVQGEVVVEVISWGSRGYDQPVFSAKTAYSIEPLASKLVTTMSIKPKLVGPGLTLLDAVVRLTCSGHGNSKELSPQMCSRNEEDPFTSICTPSEGISGQTQFDERAGDAPAAAPQTEQSPDSGMRSYASSQVVWLTEPKDAALALEPRVRVSNFRQLDARSSSFTISSRGVAALVYIDSETIDGIFNDNGFLLLPWEPQTITLTSRSDFDVADLRSSLTLMSLADTLSGGSPAVF